MSLVVPAQPCASCPYRADHPSGVWAFDEYEKLRGYDDGIMPPAVSTFHCHQENATGQETVCKGWLLVHAESVAVRLAVLDGRVPDDARYEPCSVPLHPSGAAAADAGQMSVSAPGDDAKDMIDRLVRKRAGRLDDCGEPA